MLNRELEPEVMDDPDESQAYDEMDHSGVNQQFVHDFLSFESQPTSVLDLGTGTARIPIELCRQKTDCQVMASDAALSMLEIAKINIAVERFEQQIQLHQGDAKALDFQAQYFGSVISNSLIHHVAEPKPVLAEMLRVVQPGGAIFVRDLMRPESLQAVEELVQLHTKTETEQSRQLFRQSLIAALTLEEIGELVRQLGFDPDSVTATSDRHWTWAARQIDSD